MRSLGLPLIVVLILCLPPVAAADPGSGYYEIYDRTFTIRDDRLLDVHENVTLVNTSSSTRITSVTWTIPSTDLSQVQVWDDVGPLTHTTTPLDSSTRLKINFRGLGIRPNSKLTFYVSYTAGGMVSGSGVEYKTGLGGITAGDFRYDNYIVRIQGPAEAYLFLSDPQSELVENDPPTLRYSTSIGAHENFEGIRVKFYKYPAYYKLTLEERITNYATSPTTDLRLDTMLFNEETSWQFSALASSNYQIKTMYVDSEKNWHGVFEISEIPPGEKKVIRLELLYEVGIYDPNITSQDVGLISEVPSPLENYLQADEKWESDNSTIQQRAMEIVAGQSNVYLAAKQISESVVTSLEYQVQTARHGALWAFQNGVGDCSEYTDLSIALARAAGIPARAMYGWGYSEDNMVGHAWPEFYFPNVGWQPADPTWAETWGDYFCRVDPIHLTRNVRGLSSGESGVSYTYYGAAPSFHENENLMILTRSAAAQEFLSAAQYAVNLADKLLAASPDETLQIKLALAENALSQAKTATDENQIILYSKSSLQNANEVIRVLGEEPTQETVSVGFENLLLFIVIMIVGVVIVVALGVYAILRRR